MTMQFVFTNFSQWLSPDGCALFSIQLHIPLSSPLGQRIPLLQHLVSAAIVDSITKSNEYKVKYSTRTIINIIRLINSKLKLCT